MFDAEFGGQSFEVGPSGPVPSTVQLRSGLSLHVPDWPIVQVCGSAAPQSQIGHGRFTSAERWTSELSGTVISDDPVEVSYVPVTSPENRFTTHTGMPPDESGSGGPYVEMTQVCPTGHCVVSVHAMLPSVEHRDPTCAKNEHSVSVLPSQAP